MSVRSNDEDKRTKPSRFKLFLCIYCGILLAAGVVALVLLYGLLKDYEEGIPSSTMDEILADFEPDKIEKLLSDNNISVSEFEPNDVIVDYFKEKLDDGDLSYKKQTGEYTDERPVYVVYAGDTAIAKVSLKSTGKNLHKFNKWALESVSFGDYTKDLSGAQITVPTGAQLFINGIEVEDSYITESDVTFSPCLHVSDYVTAPTNTVYEVEGLIAEPNIEVVLDDVDLIVEYDEKTGYTAYYPEDTELFESQGSRIYEIAEQYGKYIINRGSLSKLTSYMVGYAADYVSDIPAIWAYLWGKSYTYEFNNESITNFRRYSEDCFSCDVSYELYVNYGTGDTTYDTALTYTFVKQDGTWYLADFLIK